MKMTRRTAIFVSMSLLSFLIGVSLTRLRSSLFAERREPSPWEVLLAFENQNLARLNDESLVKVQTAIVAITGEPASDDVNAFRPAFFGAILNTKAERRYVLVEYVPSLAVPTAAWLRVHVFDAFGRLVSKAEFNAGYREVLTNVRVGKTPEMDDQDLLIVDTKYCLGGNGKTHDYYALVDNRLTLVYTLVMPFGVTWYRFYPNDYQDWNMTVGPLINRSADEWDQALNSNDRAEVLSALIWLGGHHWNGEPAPYDEEKTESEKVSAVSARQSVRERLKQLSGSENSWIKSTANAALHKGR